jgi:pyrroline-5-carboxylate reductase
MYRFGFIGMGHMGTAMLHGCLSEFSAEELAFSRKDDAKGQALAKSTGVCYLKENRRCAADSKYIILAVKPQYYADILEEIRSELDDHKIIISLAPNYTIQALKDILGSSVRIIRAMPNTPAQVGAGMTGVSWSMDNFSEEEKRDIHRFFTSFGRMETVPESLMGAVTAASGSSPAFIYMMIEALADGVVQYGLPRDLAYTFVAQTVLGSAQMVLETGKHPAELKDDVCSPGGTTIAAVAALESSGFRSSLIEAAKAVCERCKNM